MIRIFRTTALGILVTTAISGADTSGVLAAGFDSFGWKNRVLIVFAKTGDPAAAEQKRLLLQDRRALAERDMVVLQVFGEAVEPVYGNASGVTAAELRQDAGIGESDRFNAILVGKDGGIKLRSPEPVTPDRLFGLIDSMPMRANKTSR